MQFVLAGFTPDNGFRVFNFEGIAEDRSRVRFTIRADLGLARRYGIPIQDLPLLCRVLLEQRDESDSGRALVFSEEKMRMNADDRAAEKEAAKMKKAARRPFASSPGTT
jgi:hypothetical protein